MLRRTLYKVSYCDSESQEVFGEELQQVYIAAKCIKTCCDIAEMVGIEDIRNIEVVDECHVEGYDTWQEGVGM